MNNKPNPHHPKITNNQSEDMVRFIGLFYISFFLIVLWIWWYGGEDFRAPSWMGKIVNIVKDIFL
tara:strand:+ start:453 stop:647 length:195 start_codon:yes stop_codon:yes gene_type:complete